MQSLSSLSELAAFIGLDWSGKQHAVCLQACDCKAVESLVLEHKPEALHEWVAQLRARFGGRKVAIALEQSKGAVIYALMGYDFIVLFPINPKALAKYREAFRVSGAKDDPTDGELLLDLVRSHHDKLRAWMPDDEQTRALGMLTEQRRKWVNDRTALMQRLSSALKEYFPQALEWLDSLDHPLAYEFLRRWSSLHSVQQASRAQLRRFFSQYRRRNKAEWIDQRMQQIPAAVPLTEDGAVIMANSLVVENIVCQLPALDKAIDRFQQRIAQLFEQHPDREIFLSLPGAGAVLAPRLSAALGTDRSRFEDASQVQQLSGIAPVTRRSGGSIQIHRRFACSKFLLQTFHEYARQSILQSAWAKAYYRLQCSRGKGYHAAIRALAFKWIRIIVGCWKTRTLYDEQRYLQSLRRRNSPVLAFLEVANA